MGNAAASNTAGWRSNAELPFEYLLNALRLNQGFEQREFEARTGLALTVLDVELALALQRGLLERSATRWRASARGFNFLNDLLALFLPPGTHAMTADAPRADPALVKISL
jgi:coproporphyrinogen III oxidase-like Fe-S oxidoreductase